MPVTAESSWSQICAAAQKAGVSMGLLRAIEIVLQQLPADTEGRPALLRALFGEATRIKEELDA